MSKSTPCAAPTQPNMALTSWKGGRVCKAEALETDRAELRELGQVEKQSAIRHKSGKGGKDVA